MKSLIDYISVLEDADWRLSVPERSLETSFGGDAGYYDHRGVEAQGLSHLRVDLVDAVQKHDVQHHQRENEIGPIKGAVKYARKFVDYEQGVFDAEVVQSTNVWR